jgi:predicted  nucleic acid-binding Zn-ribbon protein
MARTATKSEAVSQLATLPERVAVVEEKVHQIEGKLDDLKVDVKEMHDCLDNTRDLLAAKLKEMAQASNDQHDDLYKKIGDLEKVKSKFTMYAMAALAFAAGTGWINAVNFPHILKFLGL